MYKYCLRIRTVFIDLSSNIRGYKDWELEFDGCSSPLCMRSLTSEFCFCRQTVNIYQVYCPRRVLAQRLKSEEEAP